MDGLPDLSQLMKPLDLLAYLAEAGLDKFATASLVNLEKWLDRLDNSAPAGLRLKGISYDKTYNDALGEPGIADDFTVFAPWGNWARAEVGKEDRSFPTPVQAAIIDVLTKGTNGADKIFIDIASLNPSERFFTEQGANSVSERIAAIIDSDAFKNTQPVIRLLIGDDNASTRATFWSGWKSELVRRIFWRFEDGKWKPRVKHPNARIYVGYYNPNFHPKSMESDAIKFIKSMKTRIEKYVPHLGPMLKDLDIDKHLAGLVANGIRSITWNHAKIFAVNGKAVLTGGTNFWDEYSTYQDKDAQDAQGQWYKKRIDHDIVDHAVKIFGDAAVSAHQWSDYFWKYLDNPAETDDNSIVWAAKLNETDPKWWTRDGDLIGTDGIVTRREITTKEGKKTVNGLPADILKSTFKKVITDGRGKIPVLTVAKLGDWHGDMNQLTYPVMIMDLARDMALNAFWQTNAGLPDGVTGLGGAIYGLNKLMSDDLQKYLLYKDFKVTPVAWASRHTRTQAVAYAQSSVIICQQMIVQYLMAKEKDYKDMVVEANKELKLQDPYKWDGFIWPFDLLIAIAQAVGNISQSKSKDEWKGVFIVQTTKFGTDRGDWEDQTSIDRITNRIRRIMKGLPTAAGGIPENKIDQALKDYLHFKRVYNDDGTMYSHSKIVCVDKKLMYVGSDNAYPCYNEEHGVWVEDQQRVGNWIKNFFDPYWNKHTTEPKDEVEHFKPGRIPDDKYFRENN